MSRDTILTMDRVVNIGEIIHLETQDNGVVWGYFEENNDRYIQISGSKFLKSFIRNVY